MKTRAVLLALFAGLASASATAADQTLTFAGLEPVRIGMTVPDAERALGAKLKPLDKGDGISRDVCWLTERADGASPWLTYMVQNGRIVRIDIWQDTADAPAVATDAGVRIGTTEASILEKYGARLQPEGHTNLGAAGHYATVRADNGKYGLLFETANGRVVNMRSGTFDAIALTETCL